MKNIKTFESFLNEGDMTKQYDGFIVRDRKNEKDHKFRYVKGTSNVKVENEAITKLMDKTGESRGNFMVNGFIRKGEWEKTQMDEAVVNELSVRDNGIRDGILFIDINGNEYGYSEIKGGADLEEIARKFRKMLQFSSGRALAWLKKNTDLAAGSKKNEAEDIKAAIGSMISEAKTKPGKITEDYDGEMVKLTSESGFVELGNIFDEDGPVEELVSIYAKDNSPQGYTAIRISDLQKLIQAYNKAEWSVGKI